MTEPPRPPGAGNSPEPDPPQHPYPADAPTSGAAPQPPTYGTPQPPTYGTPQPPAYGNPPPGSGAGGYAPPPSSGAGAYGPPPGSGASGYGPPPGSGASGYGPPPASGAPTYGAPGYGPPPAGGPPGFGPRPGYGAYGGGVGAGPVGYATNDEKTWALIAHFGPIVAGFLAPLVAMLAKGNESPTVKAHSVEALNFHITMGIATVVATILAVCTLGVLIFLPFITYLVALIFSIIGGVKANEGVLYRYPMTWRIIK